jgi:excinuclease ABC subunit A
VCKGARFNRETLEVHYKGKNIAEVLDTTIEEAAEFFEAIGPIHRHLKTLVEVGLGYVRLGQPAPTLSGGEAQRVKLASELQKRSTGRTVYVLDEPTTGLHFADVEKLLGVVNGLVDKGNTVIVIEHNLDVIKTADHVIDMGPEGGSGGGLVIAEGTPEEIAANPDSYTGQFLAPILAGRAARTGGSGATAATVRKPAVKRPAAKAKPVATKPVATKPVTSTPVATKSVAATNGAKSGPVKLATVNGTSTNGKPREAVAAQARRRAAKLI